MWIDRAKDISNILQGIAATVFLYTWLYPATPNTAEAPVPVVIQWTPAQWAALALGVSVLFGAVLSFIGRRNKPTKVEGDQNGIDWKARYEEKWAAAQQRDLIIGQKDQEILRLQAELEAAKPKRSTLQPLTPLQQQVENAFGDLSLGQRVLLKRIYLSPGRSMPDLLQFMENLGFADSRDKIFIPLANNSLLIDSNQIPREVRVNAGVEGTIARLLEPPLC